MTIRQQFCLIHLCKFYDEIINIIKKLKPEYYSIAKRTSKERKLFNCNLFIMKKEDFFRYCEFIFDILFEFDKRNNFTSDNDVINYLERIHNSSNFIRYQSRLQGYLAERIGNIFFKYNFNRIKTYDIVN